VTDRKEKRGMGRGVRGGRERKGEIGLHLDNLSRGPGFLVTPLLASL